MSVLPFIRIRSRLSHWETTFGCTFPGRCVATNRCSPNLRPSPAMSTPQIRGARQQRIRRDRRQDVVGLVHHDEHRQAPPSQHPQPAQQPEGHRGALPGAVQTAEIDHEAPARAHVEFGGRAFLPSPPQLPRRDPQIVDAGRETLRRGVRRRRGPHVRDGVGRVEGSGDAAQGRVLVEIVHRVQAQQQRLRDEGKVAQVQAQQVVGAGAAGPYHPHSGGGPAMPLRGGGSRPPDPAAGRGVRGRSWGRAPRSAGSSRRAAARGPRRWCTSCRSRTGRT